MSKLFYATAAAAMFASITAFAQTDKPAAAPDTTASAPAESSDTASADDHGGKHHHHHHHRGMHHGMRSAGNSDFSADKLNACMSNATPTSEQEACLRNAANS